MLPVSSQNLWAWLISLDYVDNQLFLTDNFGSEEDFFLPEDFRNYTGVIYQTLKKYHVETCTSFEVISSLELNNKSLSVVTLSPSPIKVEVKLEPKNESDAKFVSTHYGSLMPVMKDYNKTKIALEGTIGEINTALNSIVVNFENGTSCDATVMVNDGLNPPVPMELKNILRYFRANKPPKINQKADKTVQEQIDNADVQTGKYFTFSLSDDIFEDEYAENNLEYEVAMARNNTAFPIWLSFNGLTLKGTPPEEISGRDLELILIAKNEFKQYGVPFKLHISISPAFLLKLIMKYSPYILTLIGLFVSANKIFNILGKNFYKHSKEFYVGVGQEANVIFPISFIKEEQKQSQLILNQFGNINVTDFIDPNRGNLDKEKVISAIKETIVKIPVDIKKQITLYPNPIIDQIIINRFVWIQLNSTSEMKTRDLFEDLKADCLEFVERDGGSSGFTLNQNKLMKRIGRSPGSEERNDTLEENLISHPEVNIHLLKDAILAFAFENHSIDISPVDIDVGVKQKVPSNFLFKFLKLDLRDIYLNEKYKMTYGIKYRIVDDRLCFYGISQNYLKGKTLVVQIKTIRHRIMKEIWIHGVSNDFQESLIIQDEQEMRGQGYEVY